MPGYSVIPGNLKTSATRRLYLGRTAKPCDESSLNVCTVHSKKVGGAKLEKQTECWRREWDCSLILFDQKCYCPRPAPHLGNSLLRGAGLVGGGELCLQTTLHGSCDEPQPEHSIFPMSNHAAQIKGTAKTKGTRM